jgi:hypothetical protein
MALAEPLGSRLAMSGTTWPGPTTRPCHDPVPALWGIGQNQSFCLQELMPTAITLILQRFTVQQRSGKIETGHCRALTGGAPEHHTLSLSIVPTSFSD